MHSISVIIPTAGINPAIHACLRSCVEQNLPDSSIELVVIANPPCGKIEQLCIELNTAKIPVHYLSTERRGVNLARNLGVRHANGDYLLFLDDDCVLPHDQWLRELSLAWREHPKASAIGGGYLNPPKATWLERGHNHVSNFWLARSRPSAAIRVSRLLGGNSCYKRDVVSTTLFNEDIISGGDEAELNKYLCESGHILIFDPRLFIEHRNGNTLRKSIRRAWSHGRAAVRYDLVKSESEKPSLRKLAGACFDLVRKDPPAAPFFVLHYSIFALAAVLQFGIEAKQNIHGRTRGRNQIHERRDDHSRSGGRNR